MPRTKDLRNITDHDEGLSVNFDMDIASNEASQNLETAKSPDDDKPLTVLQITKKLQDITNKRQKRIYE